MKKFIKNRVVIWGNDNANLLGVVRQLHDFNVDTFIVFNQNTARIVNKSNCCREFFIANDLEDGLYFLKSNFKSDTVKPILLSTGDAFSRVISDNYSELARMYVIPGIMRDKAISSLLDKNNQTEIAKLIGLKVPSSIKFIKTNDTCADLSDIPVPCIIKPTYESPGNKRDFKVKICNTREELENAISRLTVGNEFIIQDYLRIDNLVVIDGCRFKDGNTLIHGSLICEHGGVDGDSSYGTMTSEIPSCIDIDLLRKFVEQIDYYGPFGFDFGVSGDKSFFFEINLRIDATNYLFYKMGTPYILLWIMNELGLNYKDYYHPETTSMVFMDDIGELFAVSAGKMTFSEWCSDFRRAKIRKYFSVDDLMPFLYQFAIFMAFPFYKILHKLYSRYSDRPKSTSKS